MTLPDEQHDDQHDDRHDYRYDGHLAELEATVRIGEPLPADPPIRRIVVLRANNVGDFVVATPAFRALRTAYPGAQITLVGDDRTRPLADRIPQWIDRFVEFPGFPGIRERSVDARRTVEFLGRAQASGYDLAIQMHGNGVWSNPFVALLGARIAAGFTRPEDSPEAMGLDRALVFPPHRHETLRLLDLLGSIGVHPRGLTPELGLLPDDRAEVARVLDAAGLAGCGPLIGMHPGGRFLDRIWPSERFARLADDLVERLGASIVLTGAGRDRAYTEAVRRGARHPFVDLTDALSLPGLVALLERLDVFVTNDTGPAHLAYAAGAPTVTLFGVAPAWEWGSVDPRRHRAVEPPAAAQGDRRIETIEVETVCRATADVLSSPTTRLTAHDAARVSA